MPQTNVRLLDGEALVLYNVDNLAVARISHNAAKQIVVSTPTGGGLILGTSGVAADLIFEESASISGQGTNQISVGISGDIFLLNISGVQYRVDLSTSGSTFVLPCGTSAPSSPKTGQLYYNTTSNRTFIYMGSGWVDYSGPAGASGATGPSGPPTFVTVSASAPPAPVTGQIWYDTDEAPPVVDNTLMSHEDTSAATPTEGQFLQYLSGLWTPVEPPSGFAAGDYKTSAVATAKPGWLLCDGQAVSRSTYATLFVAISTTFGVGNGSTTFNVPNFLGKTPVGYDASQTEFNANGKTGGSKTVTIDTTMIPAHLHSVDPPATASGGRSASHTHPVSDPTHGHTAKTWQDDGSGLSQAPIVGNLGFVKDNGAQVDWPVGSPVMAALTGITVSAETTDHTHTTDIAAFNSANTGGGLAHSNLQPYITVYTFIKI
jgi:microcystin-dependent protein